MKLIKIEKLTDNRDNAFLSKKLATICLDVPNYCWDNSVDLETYKFHPENFETPEVIELFQSFEFHSLIPAELKEKPKTWKDLKLKPKIITNFEELDNLKTKIKGFTKVVVDTETTSLNIIEAQLVWVSIYLDNENIYYINRLHDGEKVSDKELHNFLDFLLQADHLIIGHNIKYDLQIIELFLKWSNIHEFDEKNNEIQNSLF